MFAQSITHEQGNVQIIAFLVKLSVSSVLFHWPKCKGVLYCQRAENGIPSVAWSINKILILGYLWQGYCHMKWNNPDYIVKEQKIHNRELYTFLTNWSSSAIFWNLAKLTRKCIFHTLCNTQIYDNFLKCWAISEMMAFEETTATNHKK